MGTKLQRKNIFILLGVTGIVFIFWFSQLIADKTLQNELTLHAEHAGFHWFFAVYLFGGLFLLGSIIFLGSLFFFAEDQHASDRNERDEYEERNRLLFEHNISGIATHKIVLDRSGKPIDFIYLSVNSAFEEHTGLLKDTVIGRRATEVFPEITKTDLIRIYGDVVLTGKPVSFEQYFAPLDRHFFISVYRLGEEQFATMFFDITKRRRAEELLKESEKRFMDVIYASHDAILLICENAFVDCNETTVEMLGYPSREEFLQTHPSELSPLLQPDGQKSFDKANQMISLAQRHGFHRFEWVHRRANGTDFPVEVSLTPIIHNGKNMLHCVWRDLSTQKKAEETLARAKEELAKSAMTTKAS